jgi:hypothetical protein
MHNPCVIIESLLASVEEFAEKTLTETPNGPINYYVIQSIPGSMTGWKTELFSDPKEISPSETPLHRPSPVTRTPVSVDLPIKYVTTPLLRAFCMRRGMPGRQTRSIAFGVPL